MGTENKISYPTVEVKDAGGNYQCDQCDYKTKDKYNFNRHIKSYHEGVLYPCEQCNFKGKVSYHL